MAQTETFVFWPLHQAPRAPFWHGDQDYTAPQFNSLTSRKYLAPPRSESRISSATDHPSPCAEICPREILSYPSCVLFLPSLPHLFYLALACRPPPPQVCVYIHYYSSPDQETREGDGAYTCFIDQKMERFEPLAYGWMCRYLAAGSS